MNGFSFSDGYKETDGFGTSSSSTSPSSPLRGNCIEHRVSKMDTLAGVAIKYGVEVADIRRLNGLVTDLQMFAHKKLQIPSPGRHPPSPIQSNGEQQPPCRRLNDVLDSFQSLKLKPKQCKVSPAMSSLQGYYGLTPPPKKSPAAEGTEMSVYGYGTAHYLEDQLIPRESSVSGGHQKSRSLVNPLLQENGDTPGTKAGSEASDTSEDDKPIRRRPKAETDPAQHTPELLMREDSSGGLSARIAKSLAPRPKSGSRTDMDMGRLNFMPIVDSFLADGWAAVRKSSSTSNLQESENGSYVWPPSRWSWKPEAITKPIFDGFPKPMSTRRNKAALD